MTRARWVLFAALVAWPAAAQAHVGSPDVYFEGQAGPHALLVTVRPPVAVPGIAEVSVRAPGVEHMTMVPLPAQGDGARLPPRADIATRDHDDPATFVGHLWLMHAGTWQVRVHAEGSAGVGDLAVPVPALPQRSKTMQWTLAAGLLALLALLAFGAVSIAGAAAREGELLPGDPPAASDRRRAIVTMSITGVTVVLLLVGGRAWWTSEADDYSRYVYKPLGVDARVEGGALGLTLSDPGWLRTRRIDDFVPDHGHLMHLFVVDVPAMAHVWHLHPQASGAGTFRQPLPPMPAGRYRLFADVVHATGLAETATTELTLPADTAAGAALDPDDAAGSGPTTFDPAVAVAPLADGARMVFVRADAPTRANRPGWFRFRVEDTAGSPQPLEPYMGMLGHAAFVRRDASTFAHVHPSGSVPMASLAALAGAPDDPHAGMHMDRPGAAAPTEVAFPYGFPRAGDYRIFVQVKRAGRVETGVFDARVGD